MNRPRAAFQISHLLVALTLGLAPQSLLAPRTLLAQAPPEAAPETPAPTEPPAQTEPSAEGQAPAENQAPAGEAVPPSAQDEASAEGETPAAEVGPGSATSGSSPVHGPTAADAPAPEQAPETAGPAGESPVLAPPVSAGGALSNGDTGATTPKAPPKRDSPDSDGAPPASNARAAQQGEKKTASTANMAAQGLIGTSAGAGRLVYRVTIPWGHSLSATTLTRSAQPTYDPTYSWSFAPSIVWFADAGTWFFASQGLDVELTDSDSTTRAQQLLLSDLVVGGLHQLKVVSVAEGHTAIWSVGGGAAFPVSKASQNATRIVSLNGNTSLGWVFADVMQSLIIQASTRLTVNADQQRTGEFSDARYPCTPLNGQPDVACRTGVNANNIWAWNLGLGSQLIVTPQLFVNLSAGFTTIRRYGFSGVSRAIEGGRPIEVPFDGVTQSAVYSLAVGASYLPLPMLSLNLTVSDVFSQNGPDGRRRAPLDPQDLYIDFVVSIFLDGTEDGTDTREDS